MKEYDSIFDGLDLDLEYPCLPGDTSCGPGITPSDNDKQHFSDLVSLFRQKMPPNKLLTLATSATTAKIDALDIPLLDKLIDSYNIMTYDFTSGTFGDTVTGHMTNPMAVQSDTN